MQGFSCSKFLWRWECKWAKWAWHTGFRPPQTESSMCPEARYGWILAHAPILICCVSCSPSFPSLVFPSHASSRKKEYDARFPPKALPLLIGVGSCQCLPKSTLCKPCSPWKMGFLSMFSKHMTSLGEFIFTNERLLRVLNSGNLFNFSEPRISQTYLATEPQTLFST